MYKKRQIYQVSLVLQGVQGVQRGQEDQVDQQQLFSQIEISF